ncbi:L-galactose dehydrogenase-like isoform X2 [Homarus americanus]|uniref:L-galactose dehydrogenase-like isoform X2 n=1 Tax=Homarus americanus TaxID=6706 RepID=UPI001C4577DE|nr:L-galactose dehydrogenase-like isoform X2 [Homarus americanus]
MDQLTYVANFHDDDAVKKMSYQPLGNTGLSVSRISLGGGPLGDMYGSNKEEEYIATVHLALKSGINYIDTAPWYGNGRSEEVIGKVHDLEFAESLDIILEETLPALQKVVEQGKARHIGITGYPLHLLQEVIERSSINIELVLSYARNTLLDDTLKEFIPFFQSRNIGVINAAAVSMGLLCHGNLVGWHPATQNIKDACQQAAQFCKDTGVDLGRLAVQHSLKLDGVSTHLMGNNNTNILRKNLDSVLTPPTPLEEKVALELKLKFFDPLPRKHWEGVGPAQYWKSLRQLRGELPQDD